MLVICLLLASATLTNTTLLVALLIFSLPSVIVYAELILEPVGTTSAPVNAQPLLPLPPLPVSLPGIPAPAYWLVQSNQPLNPLALSTPVPGAAIHKPAIPVLLMLISKLATTCL